MYLSFCDVKTGFQRYNNLPEDGTAKNKFECLSGDPVLFPLDYAFVHSKTLLFDRKISVTGYSRKITDYARIILSTYRIKKTHLCL